jgi:DNA-binding HxlR family transcriptional regulator
VADKWTLLAIDALEEGTLRFGEIRSRIGSVSQKMLTKTLRQLERDGLVLRDVYAEVPPRVEYRLTPRGRALGQAVCGMWTWAERHAVAVQESRREYDLKNGRRAVANPSSMPRAHGTRVRVPSS